MESGQEHYRAYFEDLLRAINDTRARLQTTLKAGAGVVDGDQPEPSSLGYPLAIW
jgi:hypothetical protein